MTTKEQADLHNRRMNLAKKVAACHNHQNTHMEGLCHELAENGDDSHPESFPILLPSAPSNARRSQVCGNGCLAMFKGELREAAAFQALDDVCRHILACTALYAHKRSNAMTVALSRRWQSSLKAVQEKVMPAYHRYRCHWHTLDRLRPEADDAHSAGWRNTLQPLNLWDLTGLNTNKAELQERELVARAKGLAGMSDGSNPGRTGDNGGALGENPMVGLWDDVEVYGNPYQHGQRG
jgi:hypothetical protein